jgi:hypothetical protein
MSYAANRRPSSSSGSSPHALHDRIRNLSHPQDGADSRPVSETPTLHEGPAGPSAVKGVEEGTRELEDEAVADGPEPVGEGGATDVDADDLDTRRGA